MTVMGSPLKLIDANMSHIIEVLAPAGSFEALVAAAESGADAVYFGGTQFSARQYADNFNDEQLARAIDYLHVRGVKAYVTINTLLYDQEISEALHLAARAYSLGADAFIVQDLGLAGALKRLFPDVELHASTQMTVHNPQGCSALSAMGFSRVILARELGLSDIRAIREAGAKVDLEVFVHGALCFCYSGQCLMSSMIGGRSGNRGRCAQPCRLEYRLVNLGSRRPAAGLRLNEGHLLSPSDLCLIECIPDLARAGVVALKIEGRMKRPEYVATVVKAYRWAVDTFLESGSIPRERLSKVLDELSVTFNRGFTRGYFLGQPAADLMSPGRPSNRGSYIGRVSRLTRDGSNYRIELRLEGELSRGDGIEVWVSRGGRVAKTVEELFIDGRMVQWAQRGDTVQVGIHGAAGVGDRVFKTLDARVAREARRAFVSQRAQRQLPVEFVAEARLGDRFQLTVTDRDGNSAMYASDYVVEPAERHPSETDEIKANIARTGNTPFRPDGIIITMDSGVMVPRSVVNECRRECLKKLESIRSQSHRREAPAHGLIDSFIGSLVRPVDRPKPRRRTDLGMPGVSVSTSSLDGLDGLVSAKPDRIYLSLECFDRDADCLWNDRKLEKALELAAGAGIEVFVRLPRILKAEEIDLAIRRLFCASDAVGRSISGFLVGNPGIAYAIASITGRHGLCGGSSTCEVETYGGTEGDGGALRRRLTRAALHADYTIGIANSATVGGLRDLGFAGVTVSPELNMNRIRELVSPGDLLVEVIVHGRLPLMVAEQCVYGYLSGCDSGRAGCTKGRDVYGLLDRKGYVFPMSSDQFCRTHVFNSRPLCMLQSIDDLRKLSSVDLYRIEGYGESNASLAKTVTAYREAISGRAERVSCKALDIVGKQGFTRGHFYRGAE
jgi:putative protease